VRGQRERNEGKVGLAAAAVECKRRNRFHVAQCILRYCENRKYIHLFISI